MSSLSPNQSYSAESLSSQPYSPTSFNDPSSFEYNSVDETTETVKELRSRSLKEKDSWQLLASLKSDKALQSKIKKCKNGKFAKYTPVLPPNTNKIGKCFRCAITKSVHWRLEGTHCNACGLKLKSYKQYK